MVTPAFTHDTPGTPAATWAAHPGWGAVAETALDPSWRRVVVVAAHPDDETLGAGGLMATAAAAGLEVVLVLATAGEGSHPGSPTHPPEALARRRLAESDAALTRVAPGARTTFLGLPDGGVAGAEDRVTRAVVELVGDGRDAVLVAPWRRDGHPDHEACGRAVAAAARRTGAALLEFPVWWWHWGHPGTAPWGQLRRLSLTAEAVAAKREAVAAHTSQVRALSEAPADARLLGDDVLAHFAGPAEVFVVETTDDTALDDLHRERSDPWLAETSWYEERKRALTLAVLPRPSYGRGLELGCSTGVLAAALADRCRELVAVDASPAAVAATRERLDGRGGVVVEQLDVPAQWPTGSFDLVVVSEVAYFLSPRDLEVLLDLVDAALAPGGDLVLCHWRHPVEGWPLDGPTVLERVRERAVRAEVATYADRDVDLVVLSDAPLPGPGG